MRADLDRFAPVRRFGALDGLRARAVVALRIQPEHQRGAGLTDRLYQLGGGDGGSGQAGNR